MSLERVITAIIGLGLSRVDAEIYVYLAKKGPNKVVTLARDMNISKHKIYTSLRTLQTKGLVSKDRYMFSALPFEEALELLIKMEKEQAEAMHEIKDNRLDS